MDTKPVSRVRQYVVSGGSMLLLLVLVHANPGSDFVHASPSASISYNVKPLNVALDGTTGTPGGGTPFAVHVTITGLNSSSQYCYKSRVGPATNALFDAYTWNVDTQSWIDDNATWATQTPTFTTDESGNKSLWIFSKVKSTGTSGGNYYRLRLRASPCGSTSNIDLATTTITARVMTGDTPDGGWLQGHIYSDEAKTTGYSNIVVLAKDSDENVLGTYVTENNSVSEGYDDNDAGYFKLAVGSTVSSLEYRDSSNQTVIGYTASNPPWTVNPGQTQNIDSPTAVTLKTFVARGGAPNDWMRGVVIAAGLLPGVAAVAWRRCRRAASRGRACD